ncbi:MAG: SRPBCC family protein [Cyclobacteriaceae bacterium]
MRYSNEIVIDQPREKVIELFDNPDNMKFWQKGLIGFEHIEGEAGKAGAKSTIKYQMGKRKVEMTETIIANHLPDEMESTYETKGIYNLQKNRFKEEDGKTRWISEAEFQCSGFMKIMALIWGKKAFQKQSCAYMEDFKAFAEGNPRYGN